MSQLILPLLGMFLFIGLTQKTVTNQIYVRMIGVILLVSLYFYLRAQY